MISAALRNSWPGHLTGAIAKLQIFPELCFDPHLGSFLALHWPKAPESPAAALSFGPLWHLSYLLPAETNYLWSAHPVSAVLQTVFRIG